MNSHVEIKVPTVKEFIKYKFEDIYDLYKYSHFFVNPKVSTITFPVTREHIWHANSLLRGVRGRDEWYALISEYID